MHIPIFEIETRVIIKRESEEWKGYVEPPGVVVRSKTESEIVKLACEATDFMMRGFARDQMSVEAVCEYLDDRKVKYEITHVPVATVGSEIGTSHEIHISTPQEYALA